jgi:hypothetical protein
MDFLDTQDAASRVANLLDPDTIREAWAGAAADTSTAADSALRARRHLLAAGFGDDHPACLALDAQAAQLTVLWRRCAAAG